MSVTDLIDRDTDPWGAVALSELAANQPEAFDALMWAELLRDEEAGTTDPFEEEARR